MQKTVFLSSMFMIVSSICANAQTNTFPSSGNVGIGTTNPQSLLEVHKGIEEVQGANSTQFLGPYYIGYANDVGAGQPLQYLLLSPSLVTGSTGNPTSGLNGTLTVYRGTSASYNFNGDYHVNIQSAYQNTNANVISLGESSPSVPLYTVTYNGITYCAVKMTDIVLSSCAVYFYGYWWNNINASKPSLIQASNLTGITVFKNYQSIYSNIAFASGGNVGIGTTTPSQKLEINGVAKIGATGYISENSGTFHLSNNAYSSAGNWGVPDANNKSVTMELRNTGIVDMYGTTTNGQANWNRMFGFDAPNNLVFFPSGNVLIGKTSQLNNQYKLDVAGNIRANKVVVNTTGADFVFEPSYKLKPLDELAVFVKENHHLPGIEPALIMQKDGVEVGENQTKLLQKIEELTLYLITIKKENELMKKQNKAIEERLNRLESNALVKRNKNTLK